MVTYIRIVCRTRLPHHRLRVSGREPAKEKIVLPSPLAVANAARRGAKFNHQAVAQVGAGAAEHGKERGSRLDFSLRSANSKYFNISSCAAICAYHDHDERDEAGDGAQQ